MIKFIIECSNFQDAAQMEKILGQKDIRYKLEMDGRHGTSVQPTVRSKIGNGKTRRRSTITPPIVKAVLKYGDAYSNVVVAKAVGISPASVGRIRAGQHKLVSAD